jgi:hypothetical protein
MAQSAAEAAEQPVVEIVVLGMGGGGERRLGAAEAEEGAARARCQRAEARRAYAKRPSPRT